MNAAMSSVECPIVNTASAGQASKENGADSMSVEMAPQYGRCGHWRAIMIPGKLCILSCTSGSRDLERSAALRILAVVTAIAVALTRSASLAARGYAELRW